LALGVVVLTQKLTTFLLRRVLRYQSRLERAASQRRKQAATLGFHQQALF
jgi:hypothetical protein